MKIKIGSHEWSLYEFILILIGIGFVIYWPYSMYTRGFMDIPTIVIIFGFSVSVTGLMLWLVTKQKIIKSMKVGDKIRYNGCKGTIKSIDGNRSVVEIDVPNVYLSKDDE